MKVVDMHCDTISRILEEKRAGRECGLRCNDGQLDLVRMEKSEYLLQNFALFVDKEKCGKQDGDYGATPWEEVCMLLAVYEEEMERNRELIGRVLCYEDIARNQEAGRLSALLAVEEGAVCGGDIEKLHSLYEKGVRMLTLTWNYENELGYPAAGKVHRGLTMSGREFVEEMERIGMIPDVSHLSDAGFYDVLEITRKPFVASHSNARSICDVPRNMTDDMIRRLGERGGCMGLNFYTGFLRKKEENPGSMDETGVRVPQMDAEYLESAVSHATHIVDCGGIDVLGLGSDFDGIPTNPDLPGAQSVELLWNALKKSGFTERELDKIWGENVMRLYREDLRP